MGTHINFLVTILNETTFGPRLLRVALQVDKMKEMDHWYEYPMEKESRERINELLPLHARSIGRIVEVTTIFEISTSR